jgi:hypothetical protein
MWEVRQVLSVIFLVVAIVSGPLAVVAKYGLRSRRLTVMFAVLGILATIVFIALAWPYLS